MRFMRSKNGVIFYLDHRIEGDNPDFTECLSDGSPLPAVTQSAELTGALADLINSDPEANDPAPSDPEANDPAPSEIDPIDTIPVVTVPKAKK